MELAVTPQAKPQGKVPRAGLFSGSSGKPFFLMTFLQEHKPTWLHAEILHAERTLRSSYTRVKSTAGISVQFVAMNHMKSNLTNVFRVPVKGRRRLGLPLHVRSVEVDVVEPPSYPVLSVPLESVDQGPGCVSDHIHPVDDDRCVAKTHSTQSDTAATSFP